MHHILMNANYSILLRLIENFSEYLNFNSVTLDSNSAQFLSLNLIGFEETQKAAERTCIVLLKWLMREQNSIINSIDRLGRTLLHYAAMHGLENIISFLASSGADINIKDQQKLSPTHYAIDYKLPGILELLTEKFGLEILHYPD